MFESVQETCEIGYYIKTLIAGKSLAGESECENKVLKTGAVSFDYFDASQMKNLPVDYKPQKEHLVNVGDIIISRMNTAELTGAAAYVWSVPNKVYIPDRLWKAILEEKCNPIFVWQMLIQPSTKEQIQRECSGTSGSMKNISKAGMLGIKVKKVNIDMQNEFADFVKQVDKSNFSMPCPVETKAIPNAELSFPAESDIALKFRLCVPPVQVQTLSTAIHYRHQKPSLYALPCLMIQHLNSLEII